MGTSLNITIPAKGIKALASNLVSVPSQGGIDRVEPVLKSAYAWLRREALNPTYLSNQAQKRVAVLVRVGNINAARSLCLNACLDTAPFGDETRWSIAPTSGQVSIGRLWGRGAADSKIGAAILMHIASALSKAKLLTKGCLYVLLDADEHTGTFGGVSAFLSSVDRVPSGVILGYPGNDTLKIGARGFYRARLKVHGQSAHSGAAKRRGVNAVSKLATLILAINSEQLPREEDGRFQFGPVASVTMVEGGNGFSQIPDLAGCNVDIRLTPNFTRSIATRWLEKIVEEVDREFAAPIATQIESIESWPPYALPEYHPLVKCFLTAGEAAFGREIPTEVSGPSNIGNFLSARGIPTLCGLGVGYGNLHAVDEWADLSDVAAVYSAYYQATVAFLQASQTSP